MIMHCRRRKSGEQSKESSTESWLDSFSRDLYTKWLGYTCRCGSVGSGEERNLCDRPSCTVVMGFFNSSSTEKFEKWWVNILVVEVPSYYRYHMLQHSLPASLKLILEKFLIKLRIMNVSLIHFLLDTAHCTMFGREISRYSHSSMSTHMTLPLT